MMNHKETAAEQAIKQDAVKAFISYAREDRDMAVRLYQDLKRAGVTPWIDEEDLLAGQQWKEIIPQTLRETDYALFLLSPNSLSKKGYVQKELKLTLDLLDESPSTEIFLIPVKLAKCEPRDEKLRNIHHVELYSSYEKGLEKILQVVARGRSTPPTAADRSFAVDKEVQSKVTTVSIENEDGGNFLNMGEDFHFKQKMTELQQKWELLSEKISKLEQRKILETRIDEEMRLEYEIKRLTQERQQVEQELAAVEKQLSGEKSHREQLNITQVPIRQNLGKTSQEDVQNQEKQFEKLLSWLNKLVDAEFRTMIYVLLTVWNSKMPYLFQ
jgi:hypothetical protein